MKKVLYFLIIGNLLMACQSASNQNKEVIPKMNEETTILYNNLKMLSRQNKIMFGCANPTTLMYKPTHIYHGFNNSDCKEITGQNPAYYETDFMWFVNDTLYQTNLIAAKKAYERGAVNGFCWHLRGKDSNSFYSKKDGEFNEDKDLVKNIIKGGSRENNPHLDWFYTELDTLVIPNIKKLGFPLTFRPWHEMNGGWFWWGKDNCTPEEYIKLFKMTVDYMRDAGLNNVLYVWSPDTKLTMEYYPGDDYVDILGLDIYEMGAVDYKPMEMVVEELEKLTDYASEHNKVAAITETGLRIENGIYRYPEVNPQYWTNNILKPIIHNPKLQRLVWVESWYSSDWGQNRKSQFYYPYIGIEKDYTMGQAAIDDFVKFYNHPSTLFEDDLPNMYSKIN